MKIRQEVNLINKQAVAELVQYKSNIDPAKYNGTVDFYFEIVGKVTSGTCTVTLEGYLTSTTYATITLTETSYTRKRVAFSELTSLATRDLVVRVSGGTTPLVNAARVIIMQDFTALTQTVTQIEIGNHETGKTNTTAAALNNPKYWYYDSANWDKVSAFYAEIAWVGTGTMYTVTMELQQDNGSFASWTTVATPVNAATTTTTPQRARIAFTPTSGRNYRIVARISNSMESYTILGAKIIVEQDAGVQYYFDASDNAVTDPNNVWTTEANAFDGNNATIAESSTAGSTSSNYIQGGGTNAPSSGGAIQKVAASLVAAGWSSPAATAEAAIYTDALGELLTTLSRTTINTDQNDLTQYVDVTAPTGGWTWAKIAALEVKMYFAAIGSAPDNMRGVFLRVYSADSVITKLEPQYLLANTGSFGGATGLKDFDTYYDPAEWSGVV